LGCLASAAISLYPSTCATALLRLIHPFGALEWPRKTQVELLAYRDRLGRNEAFEVQAIVRGEIPAEAVVAYRYEGQREFEQTSDIAQQAGETAGRLTSRLDPQRVIRNFSFQIRANDAVTSWQNVTVLPPPALASLEGRASPQVCLEYPAYTDNPIRQLP